MRICLDCEGVTADALDVCGSCGVPLVDTEAVHFPRRSGERDGSHPLIGTSVAGKYEVVGVLGRGGMGVVYRAQHEVSQVPVALKVLHPRFAGRSEYRDAFLAEARKAGRVVHEHSARILDVGQAEDGNVYIAMELVEGEALSQWIQRRPHPTPAEVVEVLVQIARALEAAHESGVVHRDLSSNNVLVQVREGALWVKVLDFGISRSAALEVRRAGGEQPASGPSPEGYANPAYSAPEHLAGAPEDARADVYSLGVIAYEALTGELPVAGSTGREIAAATVRGEVRPLPGKLRIPARLQRLVERMLATDPELRPGSAAEVIATLEAVRRPRSVLSQVIAGVALAGALGVWIAGGLAPADVRLRSSVGAPVSVSAEPPGPGEPVPVLGRAELERWQVECAGIPPVGLAVVLAQRGARLQQLPLRPRREAGQWVLDAEEPSWWRALEAIRVASAAGPVDLEFTAPGGSPLGYARVQLDPAPPELAWRGPAPSAGEATVLRDGVRRILGVRETVGLAGLQLVVMAAGDPEPPDAEGGDGSSAPIAVVDLLPVFQRVAFGADWPADPALDLVLPLAELLAPALPGVADRGPVRVFVEGRDRAGNRARSAALAFAGCDLGVPVVQEVGATGGLGPLITWSGEQALVAVKPSGFEAGMQVLVGFPDGREIAADRVRRLGNTLEAAVAAGSAAEPFPDGEYRFALRDAAGNTSPWFARSLSFLDRAPEVEILAAVAGLAERRGDRLFTDGRGVSLPIRCNPAFRVSLPVDHSIEREGPDGRWLLAPEGRLEPRGGEAVLHVPPLPPGRYRLQLRVQDTTRDDPDRIRPIQQPLDVLPGRFTLQVPAARPQLPAVLDAGLLVIGSGPRNLRIDPDVLRVQPPWPGAVRAWLWVGRSGFLGDPGQQAQDWSRLSLPLPGDGGDPPEIALRPGRTQLALEVRDVLGRSVSVRRSSGEPAAVVFESDGLAPRLLADWFWDDPLVQPVTTTLRVEYGQPVRVTLRSDLPWARTGGGGRCRLQVGSVVLEPEAVEAEQEGGSRLSWRVPFAEVVQAAGISGWSPERFGLEQDFTLQVELITPAGDQELSLAARTSRSLLSRWSLGALFPLPEGAASLGSLGMVPVLGPEGPLPDPVPTGAPARSRYRADPPLTVRNLRTVYLQEAELTRAQYAEIVAMAERRGAARGGVAGCVHGQDPLGTGRASGAGMRPRAFAGDPAGFRAWVASGPSRPVTGIDWFQAWTAARLLGMELAGDPELFRLPFGRELEWAACGAAIEGGAWHGLSAPDPDGLWAARVGAGPGDPGAWPATAERSRALGDVVANQRGEEIVGLDLGVREWVLDLHYPAGGQQTLLLEWRTDHQRHLAQVEALADGRLEPGSLEAELGRVGVVRGLALGEPVGWVDGWTGAPLWDGEGRLRGDLDRLPGVVRCEYVRRDGSGPVPGESDPRLEWTGMRLCGGAAFIARVRERS